MNILLIKKAFIKHIKNIFKVFLPNIPDDGLHWQIIFAALFWGHVILYWILSKNHFNFDLTFNISNYFFWVFFLFTVFCSVNFLINYKKEYFKISILDHIIVLVLAGVLFSGIFSFVNFTIYNLNKSAFIIDEGIKKTISESERSRIKQKIINVESNIQKLDELKVALQSDSLVTFKKKLYPLKIRWVGKIPNSDWQIDILCDIGSYEMSFQNRNIFRKMSEPEIRLFSKVGLYNKYDLLNPMKSLPQKLTIHILADDIIEILNLETNQEKIKKLAPLKLIYNAIEFNRLPFHYFWYQYCLDTLNYNLNYFKPISHFTLILNFIFLLMRFFYFFLFLNVYVNKYQVKH